MKELEKHKKAFELYYSQGFEHSYAKLAKVLKVSTTTVENWGKEFKWQERVAERDKTDAERLREDVFNFKLKSLKVLSKAVDIYDKNLDNGTAKVETTKDMETVVKTGLSIEGVQADAVNTQVETVNGGINAPIFNLNFNKSNKPEDYDDGSYEVEDGDDFEEETAEEE